MGARGSKAYWLVKSDPGDYGFSELERDGVTDWDGVRNALAVRNLGEMRRGDPVLFYETGRVRAIVGLARVAAGPRSDPEEPRSTVVRLAAVRRLERPLPLAEIRADRRFAQLALVRQGRLSVLPVAHGLATALIGLAAG